VRKPAHERAGGAGAEHELSWVDGCGARREQAELSTYPVDGFNWSLVTKTPP
jgi:hypothetical protein